MSLHFQKIAVIGSGTMGQGIAQWFAQQGVFTSLTDINSESLVRAKELIFQSWDKLEKKGKFSSQEIQNFKENIEFKKDIPSLEIDLVIEAIVEKMEIKEKLFQELDQKLQKSTLFASNTSSLSLTEMSKNLPQHRKEKFVGIHFFNPAPIMKLVEIVQPKSVDSALMKQLSEWFEHRGKKAAICQDSPGFIVNRVARHYYGESLLLAQGSDSPEVFQTIDQTLCQSLGMPMGPFQLMDLIGIDVNLDVTKSVWKAFGEIERFRPSELQEKYVATHRLGRKSSQGFYDYK